MPTNYDFDCNITLNDTNFLSQNANIECGIDNNLCNINCNSKIVKSHTKVSSSHETVPSNSQSYSDETILNLDTSLSAWGLPESVLMKYRERGITDMFQWQVECLGNKKVLELSNNLVYSAPTSAGKTLVAEILALKTLLEKQKKVILILPFVSVVREKMFYFQDILSLSGLRVEGFMGMHSPPGGFKAVHLAICTIEKANGIINKLLNEGTLSDIGAVIIDEMHLLGDPTRGYLLELLLTKLRYMSAKNKDINIQLIGMSATLSNLDLLAKWLTAELYTTNFRPIPLYEYSLLAGEILDPQFKLHKRVEPCKDLTEDSDNILQLCIETISKSCSVLIFCPTKNWCENLAQQISVAFFKLGISKSKFGLCLREQLDGTAISEILEQLKRCPVGLDAILKKTVSFGVAFHHAGLTMDERDIIEAAFRTGALRVLVATSTLSSGVNLPAQRVIIRTPMFYGKPLDSLIYRQMIGRAGRMGKDTSGESILVCQKTDKRIAGELMSAKLQPIESCLEGAGKLKRAILEVIASGVAVTPEDVNLFTNCTLLAASVDGDLGENNPIDNSISFLVNNEFIRLQKDEQGDLKYVATNLAKACLASSLPPEDGLALFEEIEKARQCFVLDTDLHLLYLVTPYSACNQWSNLDWMTYLDFWEKLPPSMKRVADLVGVQESYIFNSTRGKINTSTSKQYHRLQIHRRFYTALALQDLVNEVPLNEVANKFQCSRGMLQSLQQAASMFAGMVTSFCHQLGWKCVEILVSQFQDRLQFGIHHDLLDLMKLPNLNGPRARALFNAGIETLADLAAFDVCKLENTLLSSVPFESEKEREGESAYDVERKKKIRGIFITGKQGLTAREAASMLIKDARKYLQLEIGAAVLKWDTTATIKTQKDSDIDVDTSPSKSSISSLSSENEQNVSKEFMEENKVQTINIKNTIERPRRKSLQVYNRNTKNNANIENTSVTTENNYNVKNGHKHESLEKTNHKIESNVNNQELSNIQNISDEKNEISCERVIIPSLCKSKTGIAYSKIDVEANGSFLSNLKTANNINNLDLNNIQNKNVENSILRGSEKIAALFCNVNNSDANIEIDDVDSANSSLPSILITKHNINSHESNIVQNLTNKNNITSCEEENVDSPFCNSDDSGNNFEIEDDSVNDSVLFTETSNIESNCMDVNVNISDIESENEEIDKREEKIDEVNEQFDENICDDVFNADWTPIDCEIPSFSNSISRKSQDIKRISNEFNKSNVSARSGSLFDESFGLDSKLCDALDVSMTTSLKNTDNNTEVKEENYTQLKMDETSFFNNIPTSFNMEKEKSPEEDNILSDKNGDVSDIVETSQSEINDCSINSLYNSIKKRDTPRKRTRKSENENCKELFFATPKKKQKCNLIEANVEIKTEQKVELPTEQNTLAVDLTSIDIIDICKNKNLFETFCSEIKTKKKISFAVACEYRKKEKPLIGQNIVNSPRNKNVNNSKIINEISIDERLITGVAISYGEKTSYFISFQNEEHVSNKVKIQFIQNLFQNKYTKIRIFDYKEHAKIMYKSCKIIINSLVEDPKIADWILEPEGIEKNLSAMALKYSPEAVGISQLAGNCKGVGSIALDLNSAIISRIRASIEALVTWHIVEAQRDVLAEQDIKLLDTFETEMKSASCLAKMELIGLCVDNNNMNKLIATVQEQMAVLQKQAFSYAGRHFSFTSSRDVAKVLGIYKGKKVSTNKQTLEQSENPISKLILQWRKLNNTLTKMMYPILRSLKNNRIHGCCVTHNSTGRISMHEPNLQNIPRNFDIVKLDKSVVHLSARASFVPENGKMFLSADYCQLELRILAHLSKDSILCNIMKSEQDVFKSIASKLNKISEGDVTDILRQRAKQLCYGIIYGMGAKALSEQLNSTEEEAAEFCVNFKNTYPKIKQFIQQTIEQCKQQEYVETLAGRRRYLPHINSKDSAIKNQAERQAVNTTIQGSAADIAKSAMVSVDEQLSNKFPGQILGESNVHLVLHLHDELLYEVPTSVLKSVAKIVKDCMEKSVKLSIPFPVKLKSGFSWGQLEEFTL